MTCLPIKVTKPLPFGDFYSFLSALSVLLSTSLFLVLSTQPAIAQTLPTFSYCEKDINEDPNYWDYTVRHPAEKLDGVRYPDKRAQDQTLQGSGLLKVDSFCSNAKILNKCFVKGVEKYASVAPQLTRWTKAKNIDVRRLLLAIAAQETHIGAFPDSVNTRGTFNGIGIMQTISTGWNWNDLRWMGLQANTLTQIEWGLRLLNEKANLLTTSDGIYELAWYYNGNPTLSIRSTYARKVTNFYNDTFSASSCPMSNIDNSAPFVSNPTGNAEARETQIESPMANEGFIDNGVLFAFRPEFTNVSIKVQKADRSGWLTLQTRIYHFWKSKWAGSVAEAHPQY